MVRSVSELDETIIRQHCKMLRLPTVGKNCQGWAEQAIKDGLSHLRYLEGLLGNEVTEQEQHTVQRRIREAHLPRVKTLEEFEFEKNPIIPATLLRKLGEGEYLGKAEPVLFIGDCGTGKTHLLTALCVAACRQKRRVRFTTAAGLVNDLQEAHHQNQLSRALARWARYEVLAIDELGYVPFMETSAELLFQVLSERAEQKTILITTNLPFSEWTRVFPNPRLCKALLDRLTDRAHIIETGKESYRFTRTMDLHNKKNDAKPTPKVCRQEVPAHG